MNGMEGSSNHAGAMTLDRERPAEEGNNFGDAVVKAIDDLKGLTVMKNADKICEAISSNIINLIVMPPASGKSLGLPLLALEEAMKTNPNAKVVVSESRRKLVEQLGSNGKRKADGTQDEYEMTLKDRLGDNAVGFSYRGQKAPLDARVDYAVEGTLIRRFITDPGLRDTDVLIIDEAHRKTGLLKPFIKRAMEINPNLKVIFATGTADAAKARLYGMFPEMGEVEIEGRKHEVTPVWNPASTAREAPEAAANETERIFREQKEDGNILVFLQGKKELDEYIKRIEASSDIPQDQIEVIRVMGADTDTMERLKAESTKRRIVVSTNALEEGVDPNCDIVIVSGWRKIRLIDPITGIEEFKTVRISKPSAEQQEKRVGRKRPGIAHHLFGKTDLDSFPEEDIESQDLTSDILTLIAAGENNIRQFQFDGDKDPTHIEAALNRLQKLGALDKDEKITEIGQFMADKDIEPRYARMMYEAEKRGCDDAVAILVGIMNADRPLFLKDAKDKFTHPDSDFLAMLEVWNKFVKITYNNDLSQPQKNEKFKEMEQSGINVQVLKDAAQARRDLVKIQGNLYPEIMLSGDEDKSDAIKISVLAGLADRYMIRGQKGTYYLESGKKSGIRLNSDSGLASKNPVGLVSGKISHSGKYGDTAEFNQAVNEKELYELFPYLNEYRLVKPITETEPEKKIEVLPTPVEPEQDTQEQKNMDTQAERIVQSVSTHSEEAATDARTFIQKVKDNWHNLSEKVKNYFKSLSEKLKRLVGIK